MNYAKDFSHHHPEKKVFRQTKLCRAKPLLLRTSKCESIRTNFKGIYVKYNRSCDFQTTPKQRVQSHQLLKNNPL